MENIKFDPNEEYEFTITPIHELYYSEETDFGVYKFSTIDEQPFTQAIRDFEGNVKYSGDMAGITGKLEYGANYKVLARVEMNKKYNKMQYTPLEISVVKPTTIEESRIFIKACGLSDKQADNLLSAYPDAIDKIINEDEIDLTKVKGIKEVTFGKLKKQVRQTFTSLELVTFLTPLGVSLSSVLRIFENEGNPSPSVIKKKLKENPYRLTKIKGFGFKKADEIALKMNSEFRSSRFRTEAFIKYYLREQANSNGHTWVSSEQFLSACRDNIPECKEFIFEILKEDNEWLYADRVKKRIGLIYYKRLEEKIAEEILRIRDAKPNVAIDGSNIESRISEIEKNQGWEFTDEQKEAIYKALSSQIVAIIGKGGSGKSSVTTAITSLHEHTNIAQVALAGKAALRIQEINGFPASTIHRLLGFEMGEFIYNKYNPLDKQYIVIDEASMIGAELFYDLLQAVPTGARVVIMGDTGQLDSIGVGSVFKDMLSSKVVPIVKLTKIHRQAQKSAIITESIKVSEGKNIIPSGFVGSKTLGELQDLVLDISNDKDDTVDMVMKRFKEELKQESIDEIQVIVPMKERGSACTYRLNNKIQEIVNPHSDSKRYVTMKANTKVSYVIREGDKVANTVNNYQSTDLSGKICPVFNGNLGTVVNIMAKEMIIDFVGIGEVVIPRDKWKALELGYAITVHRSQGSQWKKVIVGIDSSSYVMLSKELLYTSMTRASKKCYICGEANAIKQACATSKLLKKNTYLEELLTN